MDAGKALRLRDRCSWVRFKSASVIGLMIEGGLDTASPKLTRRALRTTNKELKKLEMIIK